MWDAEQWKKFAQQSTDMEQEKRMLKLRIERDVFASFCVLYGLAHLTFAFWLYFDVSHPRFGSRDDVTGRLMTVSAQS